MRKKIFNQMEDMKGKIRVYCRVRPILQFEKDRGQTGACACARACGELQAGCAATDCIAFTPHCTAPPRSHLLPALPCWRHLSAEAVKIPDELTVELMWKDKKREWSFDAVFGANTPQEKVFEDTKHLIQSAVDGFNVCIFACELWVQLWLCGRMKDCTLVVCYLRRRQQLTPACYPAADGQTGSGKTFTIYGNEQLPGLTPKGVSELFAVIDRDSSKCSFRISCYMLELYCDDLADLLADNKKGERAVSGSAASV